VQKRNKSNPFSSVPWHPNFRDTETLPDTKVIRTEFLVNIFAITIALLLLGFYIFEELQAGVIRNEYELLETRIQSLSFTNRRFLKTSSEFKQDAILTQELQYFFHPSLDPLALLMELSETKPSDIVYDSIAILEDQLVTDKEINRVYTVNITGAVKGAFDEALEAMNRYTDMLKLQPGLMEYLVSIEVVSLQRDAASELFNYSLKLILDPSLPPLKSEKQEPESTKDSSISA